MKRSLILLACCMSPLLADAASTAAYPSRPVRIIVPQSPGGATDMVGRLVGALLSERLKQAVVVDNRAGAATIVGTDLVAKAAPDGYTLLVAPSSFAIIQALYKKVPFDSIRDFAPITTLSTYPNVIMVQPSLPVNNIKDLIALAKAKSGQLNFSSGGVGTGTHLGMELFNSMAGTKIVHVPYKGGGPALAALLAGEVTIHCGPMAIAQAPVKSGKLKALAVSSGKRTSLMPDVPTVAESGLPGYEQTTWNGLLAPAKTPPAIIQALNQNLLAGLKTPLTQERFAANGLEPGGMSPAEFGAMIKQEITRWSKVIKDVGIVPE